MKTTINQNFNFWMEEVQVQLLTWWHQTGQKHWQKWGIWVWILICCGVFVKLNYADMARGFADVSKESNPEGSASDYNSTFWILLIAMPFGLLGIGIIASFVGIFHYIFI
jgi:hypothetical protein